jgi:hypothetical protein
VATAPCLHPQASQVTCDRNNDEIIKNEHHEHHKLFVNWSLPELKIMKLEGKVFKQLSQDQAIEKKYFGY